MNTKFYMNNGRFIAGMTMKDTTQLENNNMAFHTSVKQTHVLENRKKLADVLHCDLNTFVCANQTHSANMYRVTIADAGRGSANVTSAIENIDALYTYERNVLLCCLTADCVPVIFKNEAEGVIGVIHSGWKGTIKEISLKVFTQLIQKEQCKPWNFHVQIGAAISQDYFEVDEDVYVKFKQLGYADDFIYYNEKTNKYHIDNKRTVKKQCELAGIPAEHIYIDPTCTYSNSEWFSYRRDKQCGRNLSFIMRTSDHTIVGNG
ncbi:peptidoglycan editing factor PgeF [Virgibacillus sp. W0430]|uniref:peptidoglycan editing factor PgeF n=1 Tax=Virgibacillus sp. W0430 TaxID=3391580 RepID=UPI003F45CABD